MNGRVVRFEGDRHDEAMRLLPWLVNGTLDEDERAFLDEHLAQCRSCQRELADLQAWQLACRLPEADTGDAARDWQRLRGKLADADGHRLRAPRRARPRQEWRQAAPWLRRALLAQAAVLACVLLAAALVLAPSREQAPPRYRTLGAPAAAPAAAAGALVIVFDRRTSQAQVQQLLRASQARIVDGPNAAGAYVIAVPAERRASVRDALRAAPGVSLVEELAPEEAP